MQRQCAPVQLFEQLLLFGKTEPASMSGDRTCSTFSRTAESMNENCYFTLKFLLATVFLNYGKPKRDIALFKNNLGKQQLAHNEKGGRFLGIFKMINTVIAYP